MVLSYVWATAYGCSGSGYRAVMWGAPAQVWELALAVEPIVRSKQEHLHGGDPASPGRGGTGVQWHTV